MKTYYVRINNESQGPFSLDELQNLSISREIYVWKQGMNDWMQAKDVVELGPILQKATPPFTAPPPFEQAHTAPINQQTHYQASQPPVSTTERVGFHLGRFLKRFSVVIILVLIMVGALYYRNAEASSAAFDTYSDPEQSSPASYLDVASGDAQQNLVGQMVIKGSITNSASHTNYKDAIIRVTFYSATESEIDSKEYVIYEYFPYGSKKEFKLKVDKPKATKSYNITAIGATPY